ncbi:hypothetical protein DL766_006273 [Monosporascus sp. MC13-8B]|uniref:DUF7735 domain-containing protein n=1 Tax=Monosporascus cannonballus TaxID=155416 RepID=A0ABY0HDN2_9PEZI|nr:hypothetical protein DL762_003852 [Monosporascus cannonballus]RYO92845.1 hypothetical protein DL763_004570 [Monosporascus cannonballus]RYP27678.1 hypothetical protein DL766_006273 [Monosporascus sp. MC13-8B]
MYIQSLTPTLTLLVTVGIAARCSAQGLGFSNIFPGSGGSAETADPQATTGLTEECLSSELALFSSFPTLTNDGLSSAIVSFVMAASTADPSEQYCGITTALPESLRGDYSAYDAQVTSWYSAQSASLQQHLSGCYNTHIGPQIASYFEAVVTYTAAGCSGTPPAQPVFSTENDPRPTDEPQRNGNDGTADQNADDDPDSAASRPTGMLAGAAALTILLWAVAIM